MQLCAFPVPAHECWLELSDHRPAVGAEVTASIRVGQQFRGDSMPYLQHWTKRLSVTGPDGERPAHAELGDDPAARFRVNVPGRHALLWESERFTAEIPRLRFEAYLEEAGLFPLAENWLSRRPGLDTVREVYYRYPKALFAAGASDPETLHPLGARLELVPLSDPYLHRVGDTMSFRVLFEGRPLAGALVRAIPRAAPETTTGARSGKDGTVSLQLKHSGLWLLNAVWLLPANETGFDWQSLWASLTFALPP